MSKLLSSINLGDILVKNRVVMAPMCMYKAKHNDGKPRTFHKLHYASRALGGVGLIVVEATAVEERGRISNNDLGLWNDEQIQPHADLVKDCKKYNAIMAVQLAHAGRKSQCMDSQCVAPSKIKFSNFYNTPYELETDEIKKIILKFVEAAKRAILAGYDLVEIHAAHGYLIHEFLSPLTNLREDEYGGSFENRVRILVEIMQKFSEENIKFGVRISADEWENDGFRIDDSKNLAKILEENGALYIHVSAGGNHDKPSLMPDIVPFYQCEYAKEIKKVVNIPVISVGLIKTATEGEALLIGEVCDMVAYGRGLLENPNLVQYAMVEFNEKTNLEESYKRAFQ